MTMILLGNWVHINKKLNFAEEEDLEIISNFGLKRRQITSLKRKRMKSILKDFSFLVCSIDTLSSLRR
jgi:hypothetical protein